MRRLLNRRQACLQLAGAALGLPLSATGATATAKATAGAEAAAGSGARWLPWPAGRSTPALELPDVEGAPWSLAQQQGRPLLLNFWASWCEPCRAELPSLGLLAQHFQGQGLQVVAVNFKEAADTVRRVRNTQALPLVWLRDSYGEAARAWGVRSFPTTVLISPRGRAVLTVQGEVDWADAAVQQRLAASW
jgi:thiol-disulfide isomerase/thioredoxin